MKREYEKIEAFKVKFDAKDQIVAACDIYEAPMKFYGMGSWYCINTGVRWSNDGTYCTLSDDLMVSYIKYSS